MKAKNMFRMTALCMGLVLALTGCASAAPSSVSASTAESTATSAAASQAVSSQAASAEAAQDLTGQTLMIYCGAGMQQPFEEIATAFSEETGCEMNVTYANAAQLQTQITQSQEGAFFIAGSADEVKPVEEYVVSSTDLVKHIPVLAVAEGNPKGITGIADLAREDVTTVTGDAEATPIGKIAKKAFQDFGVTDQVTLAATTTTAPQLATVIALGEADAVMKALLTVPGVSEIQITGHQNGETSATVQVPQGEDLRAAVSAALAAAGCPVLGLTTASMSLEDVFLQLTAQAGDEEAMEVLESQEEESLRPEDLDFVQNAVEGTAQPDEEELWQEDASAQAEEEEADEK